MFTLRNYQQWSIHHLYEALRKHRRVCLACPTGSGKRVMAVSVCMDGVRHGSRMLIATNRRLLVDQMVKECEEHGVHYGVIMSDYLAGDPGGPVQIASIQTLQSWYLNPGLGAMYGRGLPEYEALLIDEAHASADSYVPLQELRPEAKTIGFTATPVGAEGRSLVTRHYDQIVEGAKNSQLIADGFLLPTVVHTLPEPDIEGIHVVNGKEYNQKELGLAIGDCVSFSNVFEAWEPFRDRKTICFVPTVKLGHDIEKQFNFWLGPEKAHLIHAKTSPTDRSRILGDVEQGGGQVVISVDVLREGFDLPVLSCCIDLQPNNQLRTYWQKLGRIKRPYADQSHCIVLDAAGNYWKFPHPDEDPIWPEGEETTQEAIERSRKAGEGSQPISCPGCHKAYSPSSRPPKCPYCGHIIQGNPVRRIRMGNGKLKEVPAYAKAKVEKTQAQKNLSQWQSCLFMGLKSGLTYGQLAKIYKDKTGENPRDGWPGTFAAGGLGWKRRVRDDMDARTIVLSCKKAKP